jgi:hypothetical protein
MDGKVAWNKAFEAKLRELEAKKPVVWGGDINVVASGNECVLRPFEPLPPLPPLRAHSASFPPLSSGSISDAQKNWNKVRVQVLLACLFLSSARGALMPARGLLRSPPFLLLSRSVLDGPRPNSKASSLNSLLAYTTRGEISKVRPHPPPFSPSSVLPPSPSLSTDDPSSSAARTFNSMLLQVPTESNTPFTRSECSNERRARDGDSIRLS